MRVRVLILLLLAVATLTSCSSCSEDPVHSDKVVSVDRSDWLRIDNTVVRRNTDSSSPPSEIGAERPGGSEVRPEPSDDDLVQRC